MNRRKLYLLIVLAALLGIALLPLNAQASLYNWNVATSGVWDLNANWSPSGIPGTLAADTATINRAETLTVTAGVDHTFNQLTIGSSTNTLQLSNGTGFTLSGAGNKFTNAGTINIGTTGATSSTFISTTGASTNNGTINMAGTSTIKGGGAVTNNGTISGSGAFANPLTNASTGTVTASGGTSAAPQTFTLSNSTPFRPSSHSV